MTDLVSISRSDCRRLWLAVLATGVFVVATSVQGATRRGYDAWHQSISALSLGPFGWVQDVFFVLLGLALLSTVPVWQRLLAGGLGERAYPALTALTGVSLIMAGWVPQDPAPGYDPEQLGHSLPTMAGLIHLVAAGVGAACSCATLFVMGTRFTTLPNWRGWAFFSYGIAVLTLVCVVVYATWSTQPTGLAGTFERMVFILPGLWGYAVVARLAVGTPFMKTPPAPAVTPGPPRAGRESAHRTVTKFPQRIPLADSEAGLVGVLEPMSSCHRTSSRVRRV